MADRPLTGVRVLDLTRLLPGPFATLVLADLGADVVKVEAPGAGDYMRAMPPAKGGMSGGFWAVNRGKRSIVLDLKDDADRDRFLDMVESADIVIESFRPGVIDRLGVGYAALRERNPKIVLCSISGYGQDGPYEQRAGHDINYIGLAGVLALGGDAGGPPLVPGVQIADLAGGALWAVTGILGALFGRERTGEGAHLDISMTEGALALLAPQLGYLDCGGRAPTRGTGLLDGGWACYAVYRTRDDRYLSVGSLEPKFWLAFNGAIGREADLTELLAPADKQREIRDQIQAIIETRDRAEWVDILAEHDCCAEPVLELDEVLAHPIHGERGVFFTQSDERAGDILGIRLPVGRPDPQRVAPRHGEHTAEVLAEWGAEPKD